MRLKHGIMNEFNALECINKIWDRLQKAGLLNGGSGSIHSLLADQGGCRIFEEYVYPYSASRMHRMFSVTKSFVSLAIGFLIEEGKLSLEDKIVTFFPEYEPKGGFHPYLSDMTIRDMLRMETCHTSTTYKFHVNTNWVESFFVTQPSHRSGKVFNYDTSSSHTLAALVKKLSGMGVLDYLRTKIPSEYIFSKDAYIITDPFGDEIGGAGLMCYPEDLLKAGRFVMDELLKDDKLCDGQNEESLSEGALLAFCKGDHCTEVTSFGDYIKEAVSFKVPNIQTGQVTEERQGYGYQFWRIRGGFCMYGMGGQYVLFYPQYDLVIVTTADLQNIKGGTQPLLDIIHDSLLEYAPSFSKYEKDIEECTLLKNYSPCFDYTYRILNEPLTNGFKESGDKARFESFHISYGDSGCLSIKQRSGSGVIDYIIPFDLTKECEGSLPLVDPATGQLLSATSREVPFISKSRWTASDTLYIELSLIGEDVGSIHINMNISADNLTVQMRKIVEARFEDFTGFIEGVADSI